MGGGFGGGSIRVFGKFVFLFSFLGIYNAILAGQTGGVVKRNIALVGVTTCLAGGTFFALNFKL